MTNIMNYLNVNIDMKVYVIESWFYMEVCMFVFRKGIGKLKHLSYYEKNQIIDNLPVNIGYDVVAMVGTGDEKYDYYDLKLFRKKDKDGKSQ